MGTEHTGSEVRAGGQRAVSGRGTRNQAGTSPGGTGQLPGTPGGGGAGGTELARTCLPHRHPRLGRGGPQSGSLASPPAWPAADCGGLATSPSWKGCPGLDGYPGLSPPAKHTLHAPCACLSGLSGQSCSPAKFSSDMRSETTIHMLSAKASPCPSVSPVTLGPQ